MNLCVVRRKTRSEKRGWIRRKIRGESDRKIPLGGVFEFLQEVRSRNTGEGYPWGSTGPG